jgi:hypothetical protein
MAHDLITALDRLTDTDLLTGLRSSLAQERRSAAEVIAHLVLVERRHLFAAQGFDSMWAYCIQGLALSEPEAALRLEVSRVSSRFPVVLEMLGAGSLHMSGVRLLGPLLRADNVETLLQAASGRSKRAIEEMVAALQPKPDVPTSVRRLPAPRESVPARPIAPALSASLPVPPSAVPRPAPAVVAPLSPDRFRLQLTIDAETRIMLQEARDLLSHTLPRGDDLAVLKRALRTLLDDLSRNKYAATSRPVAAPRPTAPDSRHIPAQVRRAVHERDGGSCAFVGSGGRRCGSRRRIEFHHVVPYMAGGEATIENIELRCGLHNHYESQVFFCHPEAPLPGP